MALTNYRAYKWLIKLLWEYPETYGMTHEQINQAYKMARYRIYSDGKKGLLSPDDIEKEGLYKKDKKKKKTDENYSKTDTLTYKTLTNWRNAIWMAFGLIIWHPIVNGKKLSQRYHLLNSDLLEETKTLWETINQLASEEARGDAYYSPATTKKFNKAYKDFYSSSDGMGFVSVVDGGVNYPDWQFGYKEEPEMVDIIRFSMTIGEALVIRDGKKNVVLESQELKPINGRWYVIGNLYEYGDDDKESSRLVVYDVEDIKLSEDEDVSGPDYKVVKDFNATHLMPWDWNKHFSPDKVVSLYIKVNGLLFDIHPFCETQMNLGNYSQNTLPQYIYKIYVKPNKDFLLQYLAYDDMRVRVCEAPDDTVKSDTDISEEQIKYLRSIKRRK